MAAFQARANAELVDGQFNASAGFAIPEGQKLSARFISVFVMVPIGQTIQVNFNADTGGTGGFVPMTLQGTTFTPFGALNVFVAAFGFLHFAAGAFMVNLSRSRPTESAAPGIGRLSVFVSGYTSALD